MTIDITDEQFNATTNLADAMTRYIDAYNITKRTEITLKYDSVMDKIGLGGVTIVTGKKEIKPLPNKKHSVEHDDKHPITHGQVPYCTACGTIAKLQDSKYWYCPNESCANNCRINGIDDIHFRI